MFCNKPLKPLTIKSVATYTLAQAPEVQVSVPGKDSVTTRDKALDKIKQMLESGELPTELSIGLSTEQLILTVAPGKITNAEGDEEQEPLEVAVRELQKFLFLKLRTQRLKLGATQARQIIATILTEETNEQDVDQLEEMLKGNFKTLKEFVGVLKEYRQAKPGAETALIILDEALEFNLSSPATSGTANSSDEMDTLTSDTEALVAKAETTETTAEEITMQKSKNGKPRRAQPIDSKAGSNNATNS